MNWMTPDFQDLAHSVVVSHLHYILNMLRNIITYFNFITTLLITLNMQQKVVQSANVINSSRYDIFINDV